MEAAVRVEQLVLNKTVTLNAEVLIDIEKYEYRRKKRTLPITSTTVGESTTKNDSSTKDFGEFEKTKNAKTRSNLKYHPAITPHTFRWGKKLDSTHTSNYVAQKQEETYEFLHSHPKPNSIKYHLLGGSSFHSSLSFNEEPFPSNFRFNVLQRGYTPYLRDR